ncbi:MAG: nucleotidyl transferase AbiEii/AbiGii toxin family protein [Glaciecola sp.]|nr:nucleotidyl transferase AbiEii/AbiGii toxin family protein [Glaciecola sp.]MDG2098580.1 nucleotidyl transferase AbiEii/AbiGii toxin family protein [Glaciecola sp.]
MQLKDYMENTLLNIAGKLPQGLVELYQLVDKATRALAIPYLVVGATARDIVLVHGYNATIERGTRDVDFGIHVQTWAQFEQLKAVLLQLGFEEHKDKIHQLNMLDSSNMPWEIDIIPFGELAHSAIPNEKHKDIAWPPEHEIVMSVMGFEEALQDALPVNISEHPQLKINVASPPGMLILKLISWFEREPDIRKKDAVDIVYLVKHYAKIPAIREALYEQNFMAKHQYDEFAASAMKIASDASQLASKDTLLFITQHLWLNEQRLDWLMLDIHRSEGISYEEASTLVNIIKLQLIETN